MIIQATSDVLRDFCLNPLVILEEKTGALNLQSSGSCQ